MSQELNAWILSRCLLIYLTVIKLTHVLSGVNFEFKTIYSTGMSEQKKKKKKKKKRQDLIRGATFIKYKT